MDGNGLASRGRIGLYGEARIGPLGRSMATPERYGRPGEQ